MGIKEHVIKSCRYLLLPVVRFVLRHGVTVVEFEELTKDAYVQVARQEYGIDGRPTNNARVAMLTGLSRREVAKVRDRLLEGGLLADDSHGNRISQILTGWHLDSEFTDENGQPKVLPATGPKGSLPSLLKRYAGDLPHGAIRKEMQQRALIEEQSDGSFRVLKRDYVFSDLDPESVKRLGVALHDHATTLEHNYNETRRPHRDSKLWPTTHRSNHRHTRHSTSSSRNGDSRFLKRWMDGYQKTSSKHRQTPPHVPFAWASGSISSMTKVNKDQYHEYSPQNHCCILCDGNT